MNLGLKPSATLDCVITSFVRHFIVFDIIHGIGFVAKVPIEIVILVISYYVI